MLSRFQQYMQTYETADFDVLFRSETCIRVTHPSDIFDHLLTYHESLTSQLTLDYPEIFVYKQITYLKGKENDISYHFVFPYTDKRHAYVSFDTFLYGSPIKRLKRSNCLLDESFNFVFNERYTETQPAEQFKEVLLQLPEFRLLYATGLLK
mgnify:CR=1 FL=1